MQTCAAPGIIGLEPDGPQPSRLQRRASVDCDFSAGDVTAFIGQQEQRKGRDLLSRSHAFHWN